MGRSRLRVDVRRTEKAFLALFRIFGSHLLLRPASARHRDNVCPRNGLGLCTARRAVHRRARVHAEGIVEGHGALADSKAKIVEFCSLGLGTPPPSMSAGSHADGVHEDDKGEKDAEPKEICRRVEAHRRAWRCTWREGGGFVVRWGRYLVRGSYLYTFFGTPGACALCLVSAVSSSARVLADGLPLRVCHKL